MRVSFFAIRVSDAMPFQPFGKSNRLLQLTGSVKHADFAVPAGCSAFGVADRRLLRVAFGEVRCHAWSLKALPAAFVPADFKDCHQARIIRTRPTRKSLQQPIHQRADQRRLLG